MFKYKNNLGNWIELPELKDGKIQEENMPEVLPEVTSADNDKFLCVVDGSWDKKTVKGAANGVASLDSNGKVPSTQLPSMDYIPTSQKGAANGVASLGADGKVPDGQVPNISVEKVQGAIADPTTKSAGQLLGYNGSVWAAVDTPAGLKGASGTLTVAGWAKQANNSFAQTVTISNIGLTSASNVIVDCALTMSDLDADVSVLTAWGNVNNAVAGTNQLTFYCYAVKPDVNIPVNVVVSG